MSPADQAVFDPGVGVIRLSRRHLQRLAEIERGARPGTGTGTGIDGQLLRLGAIDHHRPHPALAGSIAVLAATRSRFWLRRWQHGEASAIEGLVGPAGILLLPGGPDADELQDLRHHPRSGALARVLAAMIGLDPSACDPSLPDGSCSWDELCSATTNSSPAWVRRRDGDEPARLYDLVWQPHTGGPHGSVLVLLDQPGRGLAEIRSEPGVAGRYLLSPREPQQVWFGLCRLAAHVDPRAGADRKDLNPRSNGRAAPAPPPPVRPVFRRLG